MTRRQQINRRILTYAATGIFIAGLLCVYLFIDPAKSFMPRCIMKQLTGLSCPGCGSQRFVHALLNGHVAEAVSYNYFLPFGAVLIGISIWLDATRRSHPERYRKAMHPMVLTAIIALLILWTAVRNILDI